MSSSGLYTIYQIYCRDKVYIGHTANFARRARQHSKICRTTTDQSHHLRVYKHIRLNGGWENCICVPIDTQHLQSKTEARTLERQWVEKTGATLNMVRPIRTRDDILAGKKASYQRCRDKILKTKSTTVVCECGKTVTRGKIARHRRTKSHISSINTV